MQPRAHMMSFDVEEYFHVEAAAARLSPQAWDDMPSRVEPCVRRILRLLADAECTATFFVLGWLARRQRRIVELIAAAGHEVASHGGQHQMLTRMTPQQFRCDAADSRKLLQDISGQPVLGYRAPTFSLVQPTAWAIDVLAETGYSYDSSIFPIRHDRYGVSDAPRQPHLAAGPGGGRLLEIPPLTWRLWRANIPVGGGGYLRLLPVRAVRAGLRQAQQHGYSGMIYMHPWEIDPHQPRLPMGTLSRWRHRVGLCSAEVKLQSLLGRYRFSDVRSLLPDLMDQAAETRTYGATGS
jgi:polysaccharide deacetylase family protein (PEP-CTERM system associated)